MRDVLSYVIYSKDATEVMVALTNIQGNIVDFRNLVLQPGFNESNTEVQHLPAGIYILSAINKQSVQTVKVVVSK